ncbi:MAG: hypothetical protein HZB24_00290, partial [Desulfobacterales bacterium]|nr:hypothetical protein [Desulfobacterales bacterium]
EQALRYAAAMGGAKIDRLLRINWDCAVDPDAWQTSLMLGDAIKSIPADLILCGKKAVDTNGCQVGGFIAAHLSLPQVSGIVDLKLADSGKRAVVHRAMGKGDRMEVECDLPAVLTVDLGLNDSRYPSMPDRFCARKMPVVVITPERSSMERNGYEALSRTTGFSFPRPKTRKVFTPDSNLSVTERMKAMLMGGGAKKEGGSVLEGTDDQLAGYLCDFLRENNILKKENA